MGLVKSEDANHAGLNQMLESVAWPLPDTGQIFKHFERSLCRRPIRERLQLLSVRFRLSFAERMLQQTLREEKSPVNRQTGFSGQKRGHQFTGAIRTD